MSPKISIIVPVYNVEKFLPQCLDSILAQTYTDYELILVDDGSKDRSPTICDDYAARDNRISVVHKSNGGVSAARNTGIEAARGEYITFIDSDDYISPDYLEAFFQAASPALPTDALIVHKGIEPFFDDGSTDVHCLPDSAFPIRNPFEYSELYLLLLGPCLKLYRRSIITESHVRFNTALSNGEDRIFVQDYLLAEGCQRICVVNYMGYHYRRDGNEFSLTHAKGKYEAWILFAEENLKKWKRLKEKYDIADNVFPPLIIAHYKDACFCAISSLLSTRSEKGFRQRYRCYKKAASMLKSYKHFHILDYNNHYISIIERLPVFLSYPLLSFSVRFVFPK